MAERPEEDGGWWSSWYKAAKDKSVEVLEFVKKDLDEFSTAVKSEASNVVHSTSTVFKDTLKLDEPDSTASSMKRSVSSFLGQVTQALNPSPDDEDQEALLITDSQPVQLTHFQILLHTMIQNPETYLSNPESEPELSQQFQAWLDIIEDQLDTERLTKLLASSPDLQKHYTTLVPDQVSHRLFWERYLFRKALLEDQEAHRQAAERKAEREKQEAENFEWDHNETFGGNLELSEEEQTRILLEYQQECENKRNQVNNKPDLSSTIDDNHYTSGDHSENTVSTKTSKADELSEEVSEKVLLDVSTIKEKTKRDMVIIGDTTSNTSSSVDKESVDGDWEKEFDLDEPEMTGQQAVAANQ